MEETELSRREDQAATSLIELALLFLRIGATTFGGPAAHIAVMRHEVVMRRNWLSNQEFLDLLGATNLIPGPNSTEMAIHIGFRRRGLAGLLVAGICFVLPATIMVTLIAWAYVRFASTPQATGILSGVKPVIIAIILQALIGLGGTALKSRFLSVVFAGAVVATAYGCDEILLLLMAGTLCVVWQWWPRRRSASWKPVAALSALSLLLAGTYWVIARSGHQPAGHLAFSLPALFWYFAKVGSVLYGSGYVLLAFLRSDLVDAWGWLTSTQLLDATAVGQMTPGPMFTTATFIGYLLGGIEGAAVATLGIFAPAFIFVAALGMVVGRLRRSETTAVFLDGVNAGSLALMAVVTWQLAQIALVGHIGLILFALSAIMLWRSPVNSTWLVLAGAMTGLLTQR